MYLTTLCPVTPRGAEPGCLMHTPTDGQTHTQTHTGANVFPINLLNQLCETAPQDLDK